MQEHDRKKQEKRKTWSVIKKINFEKRNPAKHTKNQKQTKQNWAI